MTINVLVIAQAAGESACRPGSVHPLTRAGDHPSTTAVAGSLLRSTRELRRAALNHSREPRTPKSTQPFLTLLRVGFTKPPESPQALVVSYTTVSPLPPGRSPVAVCFLWHFPAGRPGSALPTTLPCGARTFLDPSVSGMGRGRPAGSPAAPPRIVRITGGARCR